ncbi:hypothetical protein MD484_g9034, partial [Candolleomyces efflorescens]
MDTSAHPGGFLGLPDELLLAICERLDTNSLFFLVQVNHRLYKLCLPISFKKYGLTNPEKHIKLALGEANEGDEDDKVDAISFLNIAFHIKKANRISCKFSVPGNDFDRLLRCVRRFETLIRRFSSVKTVVLIFGNQSCCCCETADFKDEMVEEWSLTVGGLMTTILEKSAEAINLKGGRYLSHLFVFRSSRSGKPLKGGGGGGRGSPRPFEALKTMFTGKKERKLAETLKEPLSVLKGDGWEFKRSNNHNISLALSELLPPAQTDSKLRTLTIQSMMFLMPPLLQWTISAMQYCDIEKLTLSGLSINHKCWPAIFQLIASATPGLAELTLSKLRQIMPNDLLHFLSRMTMLTSLKIDRDVDCWDSYDLGPFPDLPKLITLHAPATWVFKLLTAQQRGLERLETLCISYRLRNDGLTHWFQSTSVTPSIPGLLRAQRRPLTLSVEVVLGNSPGWKMFEDLNAASGGTPPMKKEAQSDFPSDSDSQLISSMTLVVNQEFSREDMRLWTVLPKWLAMFPGLRDISLVGRNSTIDNLNVVEEMTEVVMAAQLQQLVSVDVNGKEVVLSQPQRDRVVDV